MSIVRRYGSLAAAVGVMVVLAFMPLSAEADITSPTRTCSGLTPTKVGSAGDDVFEGQEFAVDVFVGMGGDDVLAGPYSYRDTVPDYFCGGRGDDRIFGDNAPNYMRGGPGNDYIKAWRGNDIVFGGIGDDDLTECDDEQTGRRIFHAGPGNDFACVLGGEFHGGAGDDQIRSDSCGAQLYGGAGDDSFDAWWYMPWDPNNDPGPCDQFYAEGQVPVKILGRGGDDFALTGLANKEVVRVETHAYCSSGTFTGCDSSG